MQPKLRTSEGDLGAPSSGYSIKNMLDLAQNTQFSSITDATEGEAGGQASLISLHSYIGIPINFHEESGIVIFFKQ